MCLGQWLDWGVPLCTVVEWWVILLFDALVPNRQSRLTAWTWTIYSSKLNKLYAAGGSGMMEGWGVLSRDALEFELYVGLVSNGFGNSEWYIDCVLSVILHLCRLSVIMYLYVVHLKLFYESVARVCSKIYTDLDIQDLGLGESGEWWTFTIGCRVLCWLGQWGC